MILLQDSRSSLNFVVIGYETKNRTSLLIKPRKVSSMGEPKMGEFILSEEPVTTIAAIIKP